MTESAWALPAEPAVASASLLPLPSRLAALAALTPTDRVRIRGKILWPESSELPEVQQLMNDGWTAQPAEPLFALLPAVWPVGHRCWVHDRLPKVAVFQEGSSNFMSAAPPDLVRKHALELAREGAWLGLAGAPADRIWLLRTPVERISTMRLIDFIVEWTETHRGVVVTETVTETASEVLSWDQDCLQAIGSSHRGSRRGCSKG